MGRAVGQRAGGSDWLGGREPAVEADGQPTTRTTPAELAELLATAFPRQTRPEISAGKKASQRRRGGQVGHHGRGRRLIPVEAVDKVVVHRQVQCRVCGALLLGYDATPHRHQITELPLVKATVTEHQVHSVMCACCGATNWGMLPPDIAASQFRPRSCTGSDSPDGSAAVAEAHDLNCRFRHRLTRIC
jgi:hypothetical protein